MHTHYYHATTLGILLCTNRKADRGLGRIYRRHLGAIYEKACIEGCIRIFQDCCNFNIISICTILKINFTSLNKLVPYFKINSCKYKSKIKFSCCRYRTRIEFSLRKKPNTKELRNANAFEFEQN